MSPIVTLVLGEMTIGVRSTREIVERVETSRRLDIFIDSKYDQVSALRIVKLKLLAHLLQNVALARAADVLGL
jgi:hypothetical protein